MPSTTQLPVTEHTPLLPSDHLDVDDTMAVRPCPWYRQPSPYQVVFPLFIHIFMASMAIVPFQQFLLLYLCEKYQSSSGRSASFFPTNSSSFHETPTIAFLPDFATCRKIPEIQLQGLTDCNPSHSHSGLDRKVDYYFRYVHQRPRPDCRSMSWRSVRSDRAKARHDNISPIRHHRHARYRRCGPNGLPTVGLILSRILQGMLGSQGVLIMTTYAYIADTIKAENRTQMLVSVEALFYISFTLAPYIGGVLTRVLPAGVVGVFWIAILGKFLVLSYILVVLPESLTERQVILRTRHAKTGIRDVERSIRATMHKIISIFKGPDSSARRLILAAMLVIGAASGGVRIFFYFAAYRFGWDAYDEGQLMLVLSVGRIFYMLAALPAILKFFGRGASPEQKIHLELQLVRFAMVLQSVGYLCMVLATEGWMLYTIGLADGFGTLAVPMLRGLLSRTVTSQMQGSLFSGIQFMEQLASILSGIIFPSVWGWSVKNSIPSLFLFLLAGVYIVLSKALVSLTLSVISFLSLLQSKFY
ncbi:major facilitator superfamily domain-containing protein [Endogone sp. FLAS-F59071]|nr:major facilitator superfamily domain-containing protein [Endogone sp. FLAS-F59071]|eukprot:RUS17128.1 major facilitator superfamily domain-containing protein [Endogone sp. FLAS-F59071]